MLLHDPAHAFVAYPDVAVPRAGSGPLAGLRFGVKDGCAPSMGANLWGESPLWEYRLGLIVSKDKQEPKARAMSRGMVWRKPECKRCEAEPGLKPS